MEFNEESNKTEEKLKNELEKLVREIDTLTSSIDFKRSELNETFASNLAEFEKTLDIAKRQIVSLSDIPLKLTKQLNENIPSIAAELERLMQQSQEKSAKFFEEQIRNQNKAINDAASRLTEIKNEVLTIDKKRFTRSALALLGTIIMSALTSGLISYVLVENFPHNVTLRDTENVTISDSKVMFWNSKEEIEKLKK